MRYEEQAVRFACEGAQLYGVLSLPAQPCERGVLIVVGGPQYRAGSHRQFTLLARHLAERGIAALRFDCRGMGDSEGAHPGFEDSGPDIGAAIGFFMQSVPALRDVVLWGLCDGASAALLHAPHDQRVAGLVLLNPWAHSEQGQARTVLKHYYGARLRDREFWRKLVSGSFRPREALASLFGLVRKARSGADAEASLPQRLAQAWRRYRGRILLLTCERDLTAQEFLDATAAPEWRGLLDDGRTRHHRLPDADHTCSSRAWRDQVAQWTADWVRAW